MIISVINHTHGKISDEEVQTVLRAINRQIAEDFEPYWSMGSRLRLEGRSVDQPDQQTPVDLRGDAVIYLWDGSDVPGALGYHDQNAGGVPFGFVFTELVKSVGESWTVTLSHEALELIADPFVNLLAMGPHPDGSGRAVFHWFEMCDAVQTETYEIDGVEVSNFVLPLYFTPDDEAVGRNDFLGRSHGGNTLPSFGVNPGGYVGFYDPQLNDHTTFSRKNDKVAAKRFRIKQRAEEARRAIRYQRFGTPAAKGMALSKLSPVPRKRRQKSRRRGNR